MSDEVKRESLGLQIAGFVLGVVSVLICALPGVAMVTASVGGVLSAISMQRKQLKGLAIAGLVLNLVAALINAVIYQLFFFQ